MNYVLNTGYGDFLNAEGAKASPRAQKKTGERIPNFGKKVILEISLSFNFVFNFEFLSVFLLRSLRNLRALCVQKLPFPSSSPSTARAASNL
jgi:hypothetical protein